MNADLIARRTLWAETENDTVACFKGLRHSRRKFSVSLKIAYDAGSLPSEAEDIWPNTLDVRSQAILLLTHERCSLFHLRKLFFSGDLYEGGSTPSAVR